MTRTEIEKKVESNVNGLVTHIQAYSSKCQTEEAAKHALVLPFLQFVLGWDIFNPLEVIPEFTADTGIKRGEKVDYAVMKKGKIAFIIECKMPGAKLESTHASQLYRYFGTLLPCRIAILTDGVRYLFYTDTENPNVLDSAPFFTVDFTKPETIMIEELSQFTRETFDVDDVTRTATQLMHTENIKAYLVRQMDSPSDEFVKLLINASDANAKFTAKNADIAHLMEDPARYRLQVLVTVIAPKGAEGPRTSEHGYRVDVEYVYPASAIKTFKNTELGETWVEEGEAPDWQQLLERREDYRIGHVPRGGLLLVGGADVQKDRIEVSIWAYGPGKECWLIEHRVMMGETHHDAVWKQLAELIDERWTHESGAEIPLARFAIDAFAALQREFTLVFTMFLVYLFGRRLWPRYAVPGVLEDKSPARKRAASARAVRS